MNKTLRIVNLNICKISFKDSIQNVIVLAMLHKPSYVCFANAHMIVEANNDPKFNEQVNQADMVLADGNPVAKACKWLYGIKQERIAGMNFMPSILKKANELSLSVFFYGSSEQILNKLRSLISEQYPCIKFAGAISPPFRQLTKEEQNTFINEINASNPNLVLVALGCPKQEKWMAENHSHINSILLGLGGAFSVMAGFQKRAPAWMQSLSLEWLYRLIQEPGRLWKRYLYTNTMFLWLLFKQRISN